MNLTPRRGKKIFLKNILINLLFLKILMINCDVKIHFLKQKSEILNILKAPSRHKKFTHQYFFEFFLVKLYLNFCQFINITINYDDILPYFFLLINISRMFTSSLLVQIKFKIFFKIHAKIFLNQCKILL